VGELDQSGIRDFKAVIVGSVKDLLEMGDAPLLGGKIKEGI
jgi:hypothetical protein